MPGAASAPLLPVEEAQARLLAMASPLPTEATPLARATGRWAMQDITALRSQPALDLSAMDGYAIRHADMPGPWTVIGESAAGTGYNGTIGPGEAVRIYTGAPMPAGADCVVIQEEVERAGTRLHLTGEGPEVPGRNRRPAGGDFREGRIVITAGTHLTPRHVALAALAGHGALALPRSPRISLLSTGTELVPPGHDTLPHNSEPTVTSTYIPPPITAITPATAKMAIIRLAVPGNSYGRLVPAKVMSQCRRGTPSVPAPIMARQNSPMPKPNT